MSNNLLVHFDVRIAVLVVLEAAAVGDSGDRVIETVHLAQPQQLERRETPPPHKTVSQQSTGNPPVICVLCWTNCSSCLYFSQRCIWHERRQPTQIKPDSGISTPREEY